MRVAPTGREFVRVQHPRQPTFYALHKVHKSLVDPPGRPIISGKGSISEGVSEVIDQYLRPHVLNLPSYTKDTIHLLQMLEDMMIPTDAFLVSVDVETLYNSIPHQLGLRAVEQVLKQRPTTDWKFNTFILTMLEFILYHNTFLFQGSHYLQVQGVAMGTCCAPSYANLYLGEWERDFLLGENASMCAAHILIWQRYIDDIFIIWDGPESGLKELLRLMNINKFNLFFTMSHNQSEINFLDISIRKNPDGKINSTLFRKETAGNTILHAGSFHPEPLKRSIPFSQFLRIRRNCSLEDDFHEQCNALSLRLSSRGYTKTCLRKAFNRVKALDRRQLIFKTKSRKVRSEENNSRIILGFSNEHTRIRRIITKFWPILTEDPILQNLILDRPQLTFRRADSLGTMLVRSEYRGNSTKDPCKTHGTFPCGHCARCEVIGRRTTLALPNGETFVLKHYATAPHVGVVTSCSASVVPSTLARPNSLFLKEWRNTCTPCELNTHPPPGLDWNKVLLQHEMRWIRHLKATIFPGLNEMECFRPFLEGFSSGKTD
ncbi:uncharacterized protein LOC120929219 [Rana temporaria]|uniref:uncharacterized protein LOC120929219 n=1 Tax=Rana temporaria TaxID=8407 RepID=UPI001AAC84DB|nr:uncharacterized protein LOC120929219 [Rana temporaria]